MLTCRTCRNRTACCRTQSTMRSSISVVLLAALDCLNCHLSLVRAANPLTLREERSLVLAARSVPSESPAMFPGTHSISVTVLSPDLTRRDFAARADSCRLLLSSRGFVSECHPSVGLQAEPGQCRDGVRNGTFRSTTMQREGGRKEGSLC